MRSYSRKPYLIRLVNLLLKSCQRHDGFLVIFLLLDRRYTKRYSNGKNRRKLTEIALRSASCVHGHVDCSHFLRLKHWTLVTWLKMANDRKIISKARANNSDEDFCSWSGVFSGFPYFDDEISAGNVINLGSKVMPWGRNVSGVLCCVLFAASVVFG